MGDDNGIPSDWRILPSMPRRVMKAIPIIDDRRVRGRGNIGYPASHYHVVEGILDLASQSDVRCCEASDEV
jgi:hypothetical protein